MRLTDCIAGYDPLDRQLRRPLVIAEVGVNHGGDLDLARRLVDEAARGGADAVKFQTYKAATLAARRSPAYWDTTKEPTTSQFELFSKYDGFWQDEYEALRLACDAAGVEFLSTPFDVASARFLNELMDVFKISSSDITNRPFIEFLCGFGKPVLLSTGASHLWEVQEAVGWIEAAGNPLCLMHCVLNYPTPDANANLGMILHLREAFPRHVPGYSDHTLPGDMGVLRTAALLGARVLEKHFTHDKTLPGNDHYHAMDHRDLARLRELMDRELALVGSCAKAPLADEAPARANARRSLVAARPIEPGRPIGPEDLTWKRPASGISPRHYHEVLGMTALRRVEEDEILEWPMLGPAPGEGGHGPA